MWRDGVKEDGDNGEELLQADVGAEETSRVPRSMERARQIPMQVAPAS